MTRMRLSAPLRQALVSTLTRRTQSTAFRLRYSRDYSTTTTSAIHKSSQIDPTISLKKRVDPFTLLAPELTYVRETLLNLLGSSHPSLTEIATYYFLLPGKQLRPLLILLFSCATNGLASGYSAKLASRENTLSGDFRLELDVTLTSPDILNDWNPRMPDHTASFSAPFGIPSGVPQKEASHIQSSVSSESPSCLVRIPPPSSQVLPTQLRLAQITEMMHVASLLHDDVLDRAETRRGASSAPASFGNKLTILAGDFLLGRASAALPRLGENEVVELMATIISNLVEGEVMQMRDATGNLKGGLSKGNDTELKLGKDVWLSYIQKSYFKTASLMAKSTRASVVLGGATSGSEADETLKDVAYAYGRNLGIAFQLVDDALDFSPSSELGKPGFGADLKLGLATAPTLYAWEEHPEMAKLVSRRFKGEGDVDSARNFVLRSRALERTRALAREYSDKALEALDPLPPTDAKEALIALADRVVDRAR